MVFKLHDAILNYYCALHSGMPGLAPLRSGIGTFDAQRPGHDDENIRRKGKVKLLRPDRKIDRPDAVRAVANAVAPQSGSFFGPLSPRDQEDRRSRRIPLGQRAEEGPPGLGGKQGGQTARRRSRNATIRNCRLSAK